MIARALLVAFGVCMSGATIAAGTGPDRPPATCSEGARPVWQNPHDQGFILFEDDFATWHRGDERIRYAFLTSGGQTGVATRLVESSDGSANGAMLMFLSITLAPKGEPQEFPILIWNDYVFYPECRELAPS